MKIMKDFNFKVYQPLSREKKYDWDALLEFDGQIRLLEAGKDFKCTTQSMVAGLLNQARKRKLRLVVNTRKTNSDLAPGDVAYRVIKRLTDAELAATSNPQYKRRNSKNRERQVITNGDTGVLNPDNVVMR